MDLPNMMAFPETFKEFAEEWGFVDNYYTNGVELIPVFRVEQWLEHTRKKGEWRIFHNNLKFLQYNCSLKCTECGHRYDISDGMYFMYKYCPNCGARMIESQESEDEEC